MYMYLTPDDFTRKRETCYVIKQLVHALAVQYQVMEHLGSLESTQEAIASGNSYASFVLSKLPACSITG